MIPTARIVFIMLVIVILVCVVIITLQQTIADLAIPALVAQSGCYGKRADEQERIGI